MSPQTLQNSDFNPVAALSAADAATKGKADPQTIVGVVSNSGSTGEAIQNLQAIVHSGNMVKLADTLNSASVSAQAQAWRGLNPGEQHSLESLGYQAPNPDVLSHAGAGGQHGGIWSDIVGGAVDVLHGGERAAGDTLNALGSGLRATQHLFRASHVLSEMGIASREGWNSAYEQAAGSGVSLDPNAFRFIFSPSAWAQAWDESTNGNTQLDPAIHRHLVSQYGQKQVSLAIQVANVGPDAVINGVPSSQKQPLLRQIQDPKFQNLVTQVNNSKMSVGRYVVGERYMTQHPHEGKVLSGTIDAVTDIFADPILRGGIALKGARAGYEAGVAGLSLGEAAPTAAEAQWTGADYGRAMDLIKGSGPIQAFVRRVAPYLEQGRYGELGELDPKLNTIAERLANDHIDSAAKLEDWMANVQGMKAMLRGDVAKIADGQLIYPHLTYLGWMKAGVKDALSTGLDKFDFTAPKGIGLDPTDVGGAGDHMAGANAAKVAYLEDLMSRAKIAASHGKIAGIANPARIVRRLSSYIPSKPFINIARNSADLTNFRRYIEGFLPRSMVDDVMNVFTEANEGQRRVLISAAMRQQFHVAGLYNTEAGAKAADAAMGEIDELMRKQAYSVNGYDEILDGNGMAQHHALLETMKAPGMGIPLPSVVRKLVRANAIYGAAGIDPMTGVENVMKVWRTMVLDRPGFAVRMALDENIARMLREGPVHFLGSFVATGAAPTRDASDIEAQIIRELKAKTLKPADVDARRASLRALASKPLVPYHPVMRALNALSSRAPEGARSNMKSFAEWYGGVFGGTTRAWARRAERGGLKAFRMEQYIEGATHMATHQPVHDAAEDMLASGAGDPTFMASPAAQVKMIKNGSKGVEAYFAKKGDFSVADRNDPLYRFKWQVALDSIARSKLGRAVLESIGNTRRTQTNAVLRVLNDPEFANEKAGFARAFQMRDGRMVGGPEGVTQDDADKAFARDIVDHVNAHLRPGRYTATRHGPVYQDLVDHMLEHGSGPEDEQLQAITELPEYVYGPDLVPVTGFSGWLSKSFHELAGKPMNWMSRQPHFVHMYTDALQESRPWAKKLAGDGENAEKLASDLAYHRALNRMIPYIHNPELRTQFEDYHRNLFPFLFAQRQFLMRWGRTFVDSPAAVRWLQLTMNGLTTSGIVRKDANGQDAFYYPGSQYVTEMIADTLNRLGIHSTIPFAVPFTGEVKYLVPGLANPVTPSVGPFAAVSLKELEKMFPEMQGFNQSVLGQGAAEGNVQQFLPTIVNRLYAALGPAQAGSELASAMAMEMKYLDATGHGLPNNPTQGAIETYVARVQNGARMILLTRAALGFVLPATPDAQLDPMGLDARYKELLTILPYDQALAEFIREHPDADAYTVSSSEGATEGGIPSTQADLQFTNEHVGFAQNYPAAFPWLAPRSPGQFSLTEYLEQEQTGQRTPLPITAPSGQKSLVTDIINARASGAYYQTVQNYETAYNNAAGTQERRDLTNEYDNWKTQFFKRNPIFAQYIASQAGHVERVTTINQLRQALEDPELPQSDATAGLRTVLSAYDSFVHQYEQLAGNGSSAAYDQKQTIKNNAINWMTNYAKLHGRVSDFITTIIRPEIDEQTG